MIPHSWGTDRYGRPEHIYPNPSVLPVGVTKTPSSDTEERHRNNSRSATNVSRSY